MTFSECPPDVDEASAIPPVRRTTCNLCGMVDDLGESVLPTYPSLFEIAWLSSFVVFLPAPANTAWGLFDSCPQSRGPQ